MDVFNEQVIDEFKNERAPQCQCRYPATLRVSRSENNPNRGYFSCGQRQRCKYFQWADSPPSFMTIDIWEGVLKRDKATQTETIYQPIDEVPKKKQKTQPIKEVKKKKKENQ